MRPKQLEIAYAYYKKQDPVSTVAAADRFIKLHLITLILIMRITSKA